MAITTPTEVRFAGQITAEYTDDEILSEIDIVESELYRKYFLPKRSQFSIDSDYTNFYIYPDKVHEVTRLQVQVDSDIDPSGYLDIASGSTTWSFGSPNNYISLEAAFISAYDGKTVRVQSIPEIMSIIATNQTAFNLTDVTSIVDGENVITPLASKIKNKIDRYKKVLMPRGITRSSPNVDFEIYDYVSYTQSDLR